MIEAWVGGDGSVVTGLVQIGVEEERSRWRERVRKETRRKNIKIFKSSVNAQIYIYIYIYILTFQLRCIGKNSCTL